MALRGLIPLTAVLVVLAAATWGMAAEDDEQRLKDRVVLNAVHVFSADHVEFSRDGRTLFSFGRSDSKVRAWDVASEKQIAVLRQDVNRVLEFAYSPDGKLLATVSPRGTIWIWDARTFKKVRSFAGTEYTDRLIFGPDGETLSAVGQGRLSVYIVKDGGLVRSLKLDPRPPLDGLRPVASSRPMRRTMLVCGNRLFDARTGEECYRRAAGDFCGGPGPSMAITSDGKKMAEGGHVFISIWDLNAENEDPARRQRLYLKHPKVLVRCLTFSPNNRVLAVGYVEYLEPWGTDGRQGGILFFDAASGKLLYNQDARIAGVRALAFSPDGRLLASGDDDRVLKLWDVPAAWCKKAR
jgi:WD40 repeat protein